MHTNAHECVWEKTTPLSGKNNTPPHPRGLWWHFTTLSTLHPAPRATGEGGARARDSTVYGGSSTSAKSFFVHHTQQLAAAAQVGDAKGIRKKITEMKMRLIKDALKATGRG